MGKKVCEFPGLDDVALAAYRMWIHREDMTVEEVSAALGQAVGTVARARDRLIELALLMPSREKPGQLIAVHPEGPLEELLRQQHDQLIRRQEQLIRREEQLIQARLQVSTLVADYQRGRTGDRSGAGVEWLDTADTVETHLLELITKADREVLALHTQLGWQQANSAAKTRVTIGALERGVTMRSVCSHAPRTDTATAEYTRTVTASGLDLRISDAVPADVTAVDRRVAVAQLGPGPDGCQALLLREPALTNLVIMLFDQVWKDALPVDLHEGVAQAETANQGAGGRRFGPVDQGLPKTEPSEAERTLLRLLSLGAKDETAARHLGVSVRTVRRMIADLMRRMDARSRFQAGIVAAERGWL